MFTGIIQKMGTISKVQKLKSGLKVTVSVLKPWTDPISVGESIAVDGVCLTVVHKTSKAFDVEIVPETLRQTTLNQSQVGSKVNLERSLQLRDRLGGHFVMGHVDARGKILEKKKRGKNYFLIIQVPKSLSFYLIPKGSIALDGISLTIQSLHRNRIGIAIVPHTAKETTLGQKKAGSHVNLEIDLVAKYLYQCSNKKRHVPK